MALQKLLFLATLATGTSDMRQTGSTCNSGSLHCCSSVVSASSDNSGTLLSGLIPVNLQGLTGLLGIDCKFD